MTVWEEKTDRNTFDSILQNNHHKNKKNYKTKGYKT